jgi:hypothetical protein
VRAGQQLLRGLEICGLRLHALLEFFAHSGLLADLNADVFDVDPR